MKYILILLTFLVLLVAACDGDGYKVNTINLQSASVHGRLNFANATTDTLLTPVNLNTYTLDGSTVVLADEIAADTTDAAGNFSFSSITPGEYAVTAYPTSLHYSSSTYLVTVYVNSNTSVSTGTLERIERTSSITGSVEFVDGANPADNPVTVDIYYLPQGLSEHYEGNVQSDAQGNYSKTGLFAGDYRLELSAPGYDSRTVSTTLVDGVTTNLDAVSFGNLVTINVDGDLSDWDNTLYTNTNSSTWGSSNDFANLHAGQDGANLYIAVGGGFASDGNAVNIYLDIDYDPQNVTGLTDFSTIEGGDIGDHLRKSVETTGGMGADYAFTLWALQYSPAVVSLADPSAVNDAQIEEATWAATSTAIEFSIPLTSLFTDGVIPAGAQLGIVAVIGGGGDIYMANDSIPQDEAEHTGDGTTSSHINFTGSVNASYQSINLIPGRIK